jgi:hypothetical protein
MIGRMSEQPVIDNAHLLEIGRLAVAAGRIEATLVYIAEVLVSPDVPSIGSTIVGKQQFSSVAKLAKGILKDRLGTEASPASYLLDPVTSWIADAGRIMEWRNRLLHATWMIYAAQRTATVLRRGGETEDIPIDKLRRYVVDAEEVADRGGQLWEQLLYRYGHLDGLIQATKAMDPTWLDEE